MKKSALKWNPVFWGLFLICGILILYKCRFGYAYSDECFYLTIPYRLTQGDRLILNEWNPAQLAGFLLYPAVSLYLRIFGSTEGIVLAFRYLYAALHLISALLLYGKLRKNTEIGACILAILYTIYAPYGVMALSYNSMGLGTMMLALAFLCSSPRGRDCYLSGVFFALSVMCCPYLAVLWLILLLMYAMKLEPWAGRDGGRAKVGFLLWNSGVMTVAAVFFGYLFSRIAPRDVIRFLPLILHNAEHPDLPFLTVVRLYFHYLFEIRLVALSWGITAGLFVIELLDKKRQAHKLLYFAAASCLAVIQIYYFVRIDRYINYLVLPLNTMFPPVYLLCDSEEMRGERKKILFGYMIPGFIYSFCCHFASNQRLYTISSTSFIMLMGTVVLTGLFLQNELRRTDQKGLCAKAAVAVGCLAFALEIGSLAYLRYTSVFWERSMKEQTILVNAGPEKGILVSERAFLEYDRYMTEVRKYIGKGKTVFLARETVPYLIAQNEIAAPSAWMSGSADDQINSLREYYAINPEKEPDYVYCSEKYQDAAATLWENDEYTKTVTESGNIVFCRKMSASQLPAAENQKIDNQGQ